MKIPNVPVPDALVPADFEAEAQRLGFTSVEYLWLLAENAMNKPPASVKVVTVKSRRTRGQPSNIIPFPGRTEAA